MCVFGLFAGAVLIAEPAYAVASFKEVKQQFATSDAILFDRHGAVIDQLRVDLKERKLPWVNLEDISPALRNALIASEDKHFFQHSGIDWSAVSAAAWGNFWNTKTRGASTITMQLAGLLEDDLKRRSGGRSLSQKISQAYIAQRLEQGWRKDQILEAYLNLVPFRGELIGVHALSRVIFNKHPSGLDQVEAAIAVALIRAPNATALKVSERACRILKEQQRPEFCANLEGQTVLAFSHLSAKATPLSESNPSGSTVHLAPHFARKLLNTENRAVTSTIDGKLQAFAKDSLVRQLSALVDRNVEDGAIIVLDNASGDILAWVGSSGNLSDAAQVDGVSALRQAGSTLKPFLYELALEKRLITAASLLDDTPVNISTSGGLYVPQNYDKHFKGLISVRTALASSLNIPAVRILVGVSDDVFFQRLQNLGFQLRETGGYYGYSLALGSADVSLLNLSNAYRSLANAGRYSPPRFRLNDAVPKSLSVMDSGASYIVNDVLSDRAARSVTFGLENALSTRMWSAVKTGTSKDMRDNWCIGFSDRYTVGVWVGNASGAPMWDVSGVTGAAPVWQEIMHYLDTRDRLSQKLSKHVLPPNVVASKIHYRDGAEPGRTELFLKGTEQTEIFSAQSDQILPTIVYPKAGMVVALDPDIPFPRQRMRLNAVGVQAKTFLVLDGHVVPALITKRSNNISDLKYEWFPWPGRHALSLLNYQGELLDQVRFEVRGAVEKKGQP
ncbi:penicillin-binding protein 1C [Undibacterium jejuense]|uniref:peptidoglycan glycosyltransferase n=1 Tax=Undibacterium jejuense TaxID=1344949 RepID=A0A923HD02_9BURK|nr:penicillin-binding protein 1C [Undibacterium jejuense]